MNTEKNYKFHQRYLNTPSPPHTHTKKRWGGEEHAERIASNIRQYEPTGRKHSGGLQTHGL
jgi:hypothetical protein